MGREVVFDVPVDTSFFTPLQMQPRVMLGQAFSGLARWLHSHLVSFPDLIQKEGAGVVIMSVEAQYRDRVTFFDGDVLTVRSALTALLGGKRLRLRTQLAVGERQVGGVEILFCPVRVQEPESLAAEPGPLPGRVMERFLADEILDGKPERTLPGRVETIRGGELIGESEHGFVVHRYLCEIADQWLFAEVPCLCEAGRARLADDVSSPLVRRHFERPLSSFQFELFRPYYALGEGRVASAAHRLDDRLHFVHELQSDMPGGTRHGIVIETFS